MGSRRVLPRSRGAAMRQAVLPRSRGAAMRQATAGGRPVPRQQRAAGSAEQEEGGGQGQGSAHSVCAAAGEDGVDEVLALGAERLGDAGRDGCAGLAAPHREPGLPGAGEGAGERNAAANAGAGL
jgi:hypothetical protein